jgi:hypothetical protein
MGYVSEYKRNREWGKREDNIGEMVRLNNG